LTSSSKLSKEDSLYEIYNKNRKVLGTLIAAAVMVSMIPAMVFAADAEQTPWADIASGITISSKTTITFTAPATGEYTFTTSDRSSRFTPSYTVDGHSSSGPSPYSVSLTLNKGATYTIVADKSSRSSWGSYKLSGSYTAYPTFTGSATVELNRSSQQDFPTTRYVYTPSNDGIFTLDITPGTNTNPSVKFAGQTVGDDNNTFTVEAGKEYIIEASASRVSRVYSATYQLVGTLAVAVDSITVSPDNVYLAPGATSNLVATASPEASTYPVYFRSSNEEVATVDSEGKITAVAVGEATITAYATNGNDLEADWVFSNACAVTVYSPDEPVVTVNPSSLDLGLDSDPVTLTYTVIAPEDHEIEFLGFFVDEASEGVIEVDMETGMVTPIGVGTATVYAAIWDYTLDDWFEGTCTVTVSEVAPDPEVPFYTEEQLRAMSVQNFVEGMYVTILNRQFDAAGRDSWMSLLMEQGGTATAVAIGFLESPEFTSKNLSNEEFVATCYRVFCNRAATAAETAQWVAQLEGGATRDSVIRQFAQSPEWASICAYFKVNV